ncbi:hypothetical protein LY76DRAFT_399527 [Colletotrichum caudatum]|nr:hypothetical protein LY76DRAFT_399527 [Colletotrichum caudatum]
MFLPCGDRNIMQPSTPIGWAKSNNPVEQLLRHSALAVYPTQAQYNGGKNAWLLASLLQIVRLTGYPSKLDTRPRTLMGTVDGGALFENKTALSNPLYEYPVPGRPQLADLPPERGPRSSVSTVTWLHVPSLHSSVQPWCFRCCICLQGISIRLAGTRICLRPRTCNT